MRVVLSPTSHGLTRPRDELVSCVILNSNWWPTSENKYSTADQKVVWGCLTPEPALLAVSDDRSIIVTAPCPPSLPCFFTAVCNINRCPRGDCDWAITDGLGERHVNVLMVGTWIVVPNLVCVYHLYHVSLYSSLANKITPYGFCANMDMLAYISEYIYMYMDMADAMLAQWWISIEPKSILGEDKDLALRRWRVVPDPLIYHSHYSVHSSPSIAMLPTVR